MTIYFDLDGTLIDSSKRHWILLQDIFVHLGIDIKKFNHEEYLNYKRNGNNSFSYMTHCLGIEADIAELICQLWMQHIEDEEYLQHDVLYSETIEVLKILQQRNISIIFISARKNECGVRTWLKENNIDEYAKEICIVNSINATQNKLDVLLTRIQPDDYIVGDTEVEWELGELLGIKTIILNRGFRSVDFWNKRKVHSYESILEGLKGVYEA